MISTRGAGLTFVALGSAAAGLALGWALWGAPAPVVETYAPPERQADSSLVLERQPDTTARPRHVIPRGAVVERIARIDVVPDGMRPAPIADSPDTSATIAPARDFTPCVCAPVSVDLSLIRLGDGSRRVVASARGGTVVGGVDVPLESARPSQPHRWAVGAAYDPHARRWGATIDRDVRRVLPWRFGATVMPDGERTRVGFRVLLTF